MLKACCVGCNGALEMDTIESLFWLEFIKGLEVPCDKIVLDSLIKEANELVSIFSAAIKTIKEKNNSKK